jgi:hypothetical protein
MKPTIRINRLTSDCEVMGSRNYSFVFSDNLEDWYKGNSHTNRKHGETRRKKKLLTKNV